jgi:hypothetical protein
MTILDNPQEPFVTVLEAADAKICAACGRRAAVRAVLEAPADAGDGNEKTARSADTAKWFCFECGHASTVDASYFPVKK